MTPKEFSNDKIGFRRILKIAVPISLSNVTVPLLGVVDTGVIGQLGDAQPIAAVSIGAIVISMCFWLFGFLRMGTTGLTAFARGENDHYEVTAILVRGLIIGFVAGFTIILGQSAIIAFSMLLFQSTSDVEHVASDYLRIRLWSSPFSISMFAIIGWLIAIERTKTVLMIQVFVNGLNVVLDFYFVLILKFGVKGVAAASLISEVLGFLMAALVCAHLMHKYRLLNLKEVWTLTRWQRAFKVNSNIFVRTGLLQAVLLSYVFIGSTFGTVILAANQVLLLFMSTIAYFLDGIAFSAEVLVGLSVGAKSKTKIKEASIKTAVAACVISIILSIVFFVFGGEVIEVMVLNEEVRTAAKNYLFWMALTPLTGFASWILDGIFIGSTKTDYMRKAMLQSCVFYFFSILILYPILGNHGLWLAINLFFIGRAIFLVRYYPEIEKFESS